MKTSVALLTLLISLPGTLAFAQKPVPADPCNAKPEAKAGSTAAIDFFPFDRFDKELRSALTRKDAVSMAFLVKFPLRINDSGGTISINDAQALKTHFEEVFTPAIRKEILDDTDTPKEVGCSAEGIGYGRGVIWVEAADHGYAITVVNRNWVPPYPANRWDKPSIQFVCTTKEHRIVIDNTAKGNLRYRAWKKPKPLTDHPDLEVLKGEQSFEGTNICAIPVYTFKNGSTVYTVNASLGCDAENPPAQATGSLNVSVGEKVVSTQWCY